MQCANRPFWPLVSKYTISVQLDTTPDVPTREQCSIIVRSVLKDEGIGEKLLAVVQIADTTGRGFLETFEVSHIRIEIWNEITSNGSRRLQIIGDIRWWAKDAALTRIFGTFQDQKNSMYVSVILTLDAVEKKERIEPEHR